uniref:Dihydrodipicolinate synthase family protein n=1 Tax=Phenylobacterium glaciei TaxID=2803784 RepID=A0A974P5W7_9CAUL|nr:dihydrodipicolinate synthase family protein [Phenylobacterium glaciei]
MDRSIFQGLSAFPLTPASADGVVDVEALGALLERLVAAGVDSIGLLGSTGIYAYLEPSERRRAVAAAVEAVAGRTPLIVGVGTLRTDGAIALARDAEARGADGLLLAAVSYTPPTPTEVFGHYAAVAEATGLPICVYNNPTTTHVVLDDDLLGRLSRLATVAAVKMPLPKDGDVGADLARLRAATAEDFKIGYSADWGTAPALLAGADAFYSGVAGILPAPMVALAGARGVARRRKPPGWTRRSSPCGPCAGRTAACGSATPSARCSSSPPAIRRAPCCRFRARCWRRWPRRSAGCRAGRCHRNLRHPLLAHPLIPAKAGTQVKPLRSHERSGLS